MCRISCRSVQRSNFTEGRSLHVYTGKRSRPTSTLHYTTAHACDKITKHKEYKTNCWSALSKLSFRPKFLLRKKHRVLKNVPKLCKWIYLIHQKVCSALPLTSARNFIIADRFELIKYPEWVMWRGWRSSTMPESACLGTMRQRATWRQPSERALLQWYFVWSARLHAMYRTPALRQYKYFICWRNLDGSVSWGWEEFR